jgi:hypothetical protein
VLTRRFFIADTIGGIVETDGVANEAMPSVVRYAKNMTLKFQLDNSPNQYEKIYMPYLEIEYEDKKIEELQNNQEKANVEIRFMSEYYMDTEGFWSFAYFFFVTFMIIMSLIVVAKIYV